jgi:hypothetical protein
VIARISELKFAFNRRAHRHVEGSHHAVAARPESAAQDPSLHAGATVRHRTSTVAAISPHLHQPTYRDASDRRPQATMTTTLGCFSAGLGRRTDLPWPLPADAGQVREKGYFVEGGKESLPPKWDSKVMARPRLDENVSGVDAYHKKLAGEVDECGEPTIAVFLKTGPPGRAPALVVEGVSVTADAQVLADRAAKDLGVPVDALYYHGVPLDMAKPLKAQGVFRDPVLLEWK